MAEILREDAMSSEESCAESDEEGTRRITCYKVRHIPSESNRLKKIKTKTGQGIRKIPFRKSKNQNFAERGSTSSLQKSLST